ncbi:unnamed protein product [Pneumocystis jirovecii]|uniref:Uncharacterized protein n=1 Tax=Pneumocystis jirovecii TaxID=42068 RepID=L0PGG3_PNEJI|nr:unnamed protein product [Pneumocystis jirovecii]
MEEQKEVIDNYHQAENLDEKVFLKEKIEDESEEVLKDIFPDHYYDNGKIPVFKPFYINLLLLTSILVESVKIQISYVIKEKKTKYLPIKLKNKSSNENA